MPRRGSNIYKRKDGRFEGRVPIGHKEDGSLKYKFVYARTLSEVKEKMATISSRFAKSAGFCFEINCGRGISSVAFRSKIACETVQLCAL